MEGGEGVWGRGAGGGARKAMVCEEGVWGKGAHGRPQGKGAWGKLSRGEAAMVLLENDEKVLPSPTQVPQDLCGRKTFSGGPVSQCRVIFLMKILCMSRRWGFGGGRREEEDWGVLCDKMQC